MAYLGYRLKINGVVVPDVIMQRGSWSAKLERRLISSWTDAGGKLHESYYPDKKVSIKFSLREHNIVDHESYITYFTNKDHVAIVAWIDDTATYETVDCKINDIEWTHRVATNNDIWYNPADIEIMEY